ncbi:DUF2793 domain-containing protein [Halopseudomonas sp.]|uniref:DUF2793 domain-containing protein n=1 Tax=Halopseudomonas sp. TaxID=2901191 RepID=UPI00311DFACD
MTTPNIGLTELANGQANFLNANETFAIIDALLQTPVISKTLTAAPGSPANGALYIMASAWAGVTGAAAGKLALYRTGSGWIVITPKEGWKFECAADEITYRYDGADWLEWSAGGAGGWDDLIEPAISSGALDIDLADPAGFVVDLDQDVTTLTFSNVPSGKVVTFTITFVQDGTGGWEVTWPAAVQGSPDQPEPSAGNVSVMSFITWDGGTTIYQAQTPVA